MALRGQQAAERIAQGGLARMAHMQGAGRVGRDELEQHAPVRRGLGTEAHAGAQHLTDHGLLGGGLEAQIHKAGPSDFDRVNPLLHGGLRLQRRHQLGGQLTRVLFQRLGQLHGGRDGQITMAGLLGSLEGGRGGVLGGDADESSAQGIEQSLGGMNHAGDSRRPPEAAQP